MTTKQSGRLDTPEQQDEYCDQLAKAGTEHAHQRAFFAWLNLMQYMGVHPMARMAFAIPNGGKRDAITAAKLKAEGVKAGVPDILYPLPSWTLPGADNPRASRYLGLFIEMKKPKEGRASAAQADMHIDLRACGYAVTTCWGWRAARQAFTDYAALQGVQEEYT